MKLNKYLIVVFVVVAYLVVQMTLNLSVAENVGDVHCPKVDLLQGKILSSIMKIADNKELSKSDRMERYEKIVKEYSIRIRIAYCDCLLEQNYNSAVVELRKRLNLELKQLLEEQ